MHYRAEFVSKRCQYGLKKAEKTPWVFGLDAFDLQNIPGG